MLKPRSISKEYTLIWSSDPALELPEDENARSEALRVAQETNRWDAIIKSGEHPTLFHVRPMQGSAHSWLSTEHKRRELAYPQLFELALSLVLVRVENLGDFKLAHETNGDGFRVVKRESLDALYAIHRDLVEELGAIALLHASQGISPLA